MSDMSPFFQRLREWKQPLLAGLAMAVAVAVISVFVPNTYVSEARILPADARSSGMSGLGQIAAAAALVGVNVPGQDSTDSTNMDVLNSRWLRERLLQATYRFHIRSWKFGREEFRQQTLLEYLHQKNPDRGMKALQKLISINRDVKSKLITLTVQTRSAELSQQVAQGAVRNLEAFTRDRTRTKGGTKAAFTEQRLKEAKEAALLAEEDFRRFVEHDRNYQASNEPSVRLKGMRLEGELKLRQQLLMTLAISLEQALLEEKNDMPILNVLDQGNLPYDKNGPNRSRAVMIAALMGTLAMWAYQHQAWILARLKETSGK